MTATISSAPALWQASASALWSRRWPKKSGFWTTTQEVSASISGIRSSLARGIGLAGRELEAVEAGMGLR